MAATQLKDLATTASRLAENHKQLDHFLGAIVWVATTPDKKAFAEKMKEIEKLRKEGKKLQASIEKTIKKLQTA